MPNDDDDDFDDPLLGEGPSLPDELDEDDLELEPDDLSDDDLEDDEDLEDTDEAEVEEVDDEASSTPVTEDDEDFEEDDEEDNDDVEASLDVILKSRLVVSDDDDEDEDEDEEEEPEGDERGETATRVLPKQPGEFVCQSCFLVKNQSQLADRERQLCRDCV